ncbi:MAG TPA: hypothetical protein VEG84_11690 [Thermoanaerobaculia bacterium]|nr:hypothetical protein [Thermoanaerobaculia bacterium]
MGSDIRLEAAGQSAPRPAADGSAALRPQPDGLLTLRFVISVRDPASLEALRHARRSMLREEWTLGRDSEEPSLDSAIFTPAEVVWTVPLAEESRCRERLKELERRANRTLEELRRS